MSFFKSEAPLPEPHPNRLMADAKHDLQFMESGVGMLLDVGLELVQWQPQPAAVSVRGVIGVTACPAAR